MNPDKQWLSLIPFDKSNWWITSKNIYLDGAIRKNTCYRAYYILADGSSFGSYFRYFFWDFDSDQRYFDVDSKWIFDKPFDDLEPGDVVSNLINQHKYIVVNNTSNNVNTKFCKVLEFL
jgi:hypothetical protein